MSGLAASCFAAWIGREAKKPIGGLLAKYFHGCVQRVRAGRSPMATGIIDRAGQLGSGWITLAPAPKPCSAFALLIGPESLRVASEATDAGDGLDAPLQADVLLPRVRARKTKVIAAQLERNSSCLILPRPRGRWLRAPVAAFFVRSNRPRCSATTQGSPGSSARFYWAAK